jgi:hypothetical protein
MMADRDNPHLPEIPDDVWNYFGKKPPVRPTSDTDIVPINLNGHNLNGYVNAAHTAEIAQLNTCTRGNRNHTLNITALKLARLPIDRSTLHKDLIAACTTNGLIHDDGQTSVEATITSAFTKADRDGPRQLPRPHTQIGGIGQPDNAEPGGRQIRWTRGDEIDTAVPIWAWSYNERGRIQLGTLTLFAGRPGAGKSTAARWFAAQATLGHLDGCWHNQPQHIAYIAAEESARYTIGPGLAAAGAEMSRIHFPAVYHDGHAAQLLSLLDETELTDYLIINRIKVVIVDPLMSTITASADINKNNEVRAQIQPWARIADIINGIVIGVAHLRKSGTGDVVAAVTGSSAFGELARAVFGFAKNHENDTRVMSQHKNSTGYEDLSLTYQIESKTVLVSTGETAEVGTFTITGESDITVEDILSDPTSASGANLECLRWLEDYLTQEGASPSKDVKAEAHKAIGVSPSSVDRAAKKLKVKIESHGFPRRTYWSMPDTVTSDHSQPITSR